MSYYIVNITDCINDYECTTSVLLKSTPEEITERIVDVARTWYGEDADEDEDYECVFINGDARTFVDNFKEISPATYNELKSILTTL